MKTKNLLNLVGRKSYEQTRKSRHSLESIVSRFSLVSLICLCMLTVGIGNVWGAEMDANVPEQTSFSLSAYLAEHWLSATIIGVLVLAVIVIIPITIKKTSNRNKIKISGNSGHVIDAGKITINNK